MLVFNLKLMTFNTFIIFLATTAFSLPGSKQIMGNNTDLMFYVGTYTDNKILAHQPKSKNLGTGIYTFKLDAEGSLEKISDIKGLNPAVLKIHPNKKILYAITERIDRNGSVEIFSIQKNGHLKHLSSFEASGKSSCFFQLDQSLRRGIIVNYWDGFIDLVTMEDSGKINGHVANFRHQFRKNTRQVLNREDHWKNRQVGPHPHSAHFWKNWIFIPDLGEQAIYQYRYQSGLVPELEEVTLLDKNAGPRHMVIDDTLGVAYVSDELRSRVIVAKLDDTETKEIKPRFFPIQYISTISNSNVVNYVSEIKLSTDKKYLYVSNRGEDTIVVFKINRINGTLKFVESVPTGGATPRHFTFSPDEKLLLVANQDSDNIRVFKRDIVTGGLSNTPNIISVPSPNYILF